MTLNSHKHILTELLTIFISGSIPVFISFEQGGVKLLEKVISSLLANEWIMYYTMICSIFFIIVSYFDHRFNFKNNNIEIANNILSRALLDSASSFIGMLRISSGLLISITLLMIIYSYESIGGNEIITLLTIGIAAGSEAIILSRMLKHISKKWMRYS